MDAARPRVGMAAGSAARSSLMTLGCGFVWREAHARLFHATLPGQDNIKGHLQSDSKRGNLCTPIRLRIGGKISPVRDVGAEGSQSGESNESFIILSFRAKASY